jgi:hypothetical protein
LCPLLWPTSQTVAEVTVASAATALPALSRLPALNRLKVKTVAVTTMTTRFATISGTRPPNVIIGRPRWKARPSMA